MNNLPRPVATNPDNDFTLTIEEALERYAGAGLPRTPRSIQRYCAKGHLDCRVIETSFGEKYLVAPASVDKHIAYIQEVTRATSRGVSRPAGTDTLAKIESESAAPADAMSGDSSRPVAASSDTRYITLLEGEVAYLRKQVDVKDEQIKDLTERARETNHLIAGLQRMLSPLLGGELPPKS